MFENLPSAFRAFLGPEGQGAPDRGRYQRRYARDALALLEADVNFKVVKRFRGRTKERCLHAEVLDSLTPAQNVVKIVLDELTELLGRTDSRLVLVEPHPQRHHARGPSGLGQDDCGGKLAYRLKQEKATPAARPPATCTAPPRPTSCKPSAGEIGVRVYRGDGQDPVRIAKEGVQGRHRLPARCGHHRHGGPIARRRGHDG